MTNPIQVVEAPMVQPICPHCEQPIDRLGERRLSASILSRRSIYFCPHCLKVLGVSHRKGLLAS